MSPTVLRKEGGNRGIPLRRHIAVEASGLTRGCRVLSVDPIVEWAADKDQVVERTAEKKQSSMALSSIAHSEGA